ncbi:MAG: hypothetical protein LBP28_02180 [Coriobacteriales bacterium]|jgi:hypothetical protein|nr:hypothetical protein [Coriobacteriales bacterium]
MNSKQIIAMWTSAMLQGYAREKSVPGDALPEFASEHGLPAFLIDNYELLHLYPDAAVFEELDKHLSECLYG